MCCLRSYNTRELLESRAIDYRSNRLNVTAGFDEFWSALNGERWGRIGSQRVEKLIIEAVERQGKCPVHQVGDEVVIEDSKINLKETNNLCLHAFASFSPLVGSSREGS